MARSSYHSKLHCHGTVHLACFKNCHYLIVCPMTVPQFRQWWMNIQLTAFLLHLICWELLLTVLEFFIIIFRVFIQNSLSLLNGLRFEDTATIFCFTETCYFSPVLIVPGYTVFTSPILCRPGKATNCLPGSHDVLLYQIK